LPDELKPLKRSCLAPKPGIVHLGLGAFYRAHGAVYVADAMARSGGDWGIIGVSLKSPRVRDMLAPQDNLYTALELGPNSKTPRVIESVVETLVALESPDAVLNRMADPAVKIVTMTVTEKGYCHEPITGALNRTHPDIVHDIASDMPCSAPGYLVRALQRRREAGLRPFTVMTCDNLPENGRVVQGVVIELASLIDADLAAWITDNVRFPATMVDRIVPATKPEDVTELAALTGMQDTAPVMHEPFRQWVVEDDFVDGARPDLGAVGVQLVQDVTAFEHMKLRMLKGTHSSLAYLGYLAGHETIADTVADPVFAGFVKSLWHDEIIPVLTPPPGEDLAKYAEALFARYSNPSIRHLTWQIAMDGSQKLPQRILGTVSENLSAGRSCAGLMLAVAAWMRYVGGVDEAGTPIDVRDPLADALRAASEGTETPAGKVAALLAMTQVFTPEIAANTALRTALTAAYETLATKGARQAVADLAG